MTVASIIILIAMIPIIVIFSLIGVWGLPLLTFFCIFLLIYFLIDDDDTSLNLKEGKTKSNTKQITRGRKFPKPPPRPRKGAN